MWLLLCRLAIRTSQIRPHDVLNQDTLDYLLHVLHG